MATAWIAGGSGLVGGVLLHRLLLDGHFDRIVSVGRRVLPVEGEKLVQVVTDFTLSPVWEALPTPSVAFSCLGTTIGKAGSRDAFRKVDHDAVLSFARAARARGAGAFLHVSSLGARAGSRNFYGSVKGETERDVAELGFTSVYALRPSILDGDRSERRPGEALGLAVGRVLAPLLGKYRPTPVEAVARTLVALAKAPVPGVHVVEPGGMAGA
jgi:uncharacterized protein YbjT (DUF2867 family)